MVLANPRFEIDVTEQRPRPLVPAPHPVRLRQTARRKNHIAIPLARDFFNDPPATTDGPEDSAQKAAMAAGAGEVAALMKGSLHTDVLLHAVMQKDAKLLTGRLISHCVMVSVPTYARRFIISDVALEYRARHRPEARHLPERHRLRARARHRPAEGCRAGGGRNGADQNAGDARRRDPGEDGDFGEDGGPGWHARRFSRSSIYVA